MNKRNRNRMLWLASILDRSATRIRRYVREHTPPRKRSEQIDELLAKVDP